METGQVVKLVDKSQFAHTVCIGQIIEIRGCYARLHNWPLWAPLDQLVPLKGDFS
jgi:hypothetical protein